MVRTILQTASVLDAVRCLRDGHASALAVTRHDGTLVGLISEQDILKRVFLRGRAAASTRVEDAMTPDVECVTHDEASRNIRQVYRRMAELGVKHMPVVGDLSSRRATDCLDMASVSRWLHGKDESNVRERFSPGFCRFARVFADRKPFYIV